MNFYYRIAGFMCEVQIFTKFVSEHMQHLQILISVTTYINNKLTTLPGLPNYERL